MKFTVREFVDYCLKFVENALKHRFGGLEFEKIFAKNQSRDGVAVDFFDCNFIVMLIVGRVCLVQKGI